MAHKNPEAKKAYDRKRYEAKRSHVLAVNRAYYEKNREQRVAYMKEHTRKLLDAKIAYVRELKSQPCMDCGGTFHFSAMDFDHRPGEKKVANVTYLARNMRTQMKALLAEIAKCDLVCSNCHRVRTYSRMEVKEDCV